MFVSITSAMSSSAQPPGAPQLRQLQPYWFECKTWAFKIHIEAKLGPPSMGILTLNPTKHCGLLGDGLAVRRSKTLRASLTTIVVDVQVTHENHIFRLAFFSRVRRDPTPCAIGTLGRVDGNGINFHRTTEDHGHGLGHGAYREDDFKPRASGTIVRLGIVHGKQVGVRTENLIVRGTRNGLARILADILHGGYGHGHVEARLGAACFAVFVAIAPSWKMRNDAYVVPERAIASHLQ
ncbi:hypothetical protein PsorP6_015995 [Peronosclerospora sorghi]|uniref:Uncharacterized protein n=1 Tax=Peronosclerospora sorghi TaxID=230839 RepID=A0ACC0WPS1_9STRA|nr:hypothetical protein PsorP6_015995 [Peronosclerospora sorghi]